MTPTDHECRFKNGKTGRKDKTCRSTELTKRGNIHRGCMCIFKLALTLESGTGWLVTFSCKLDDCEMTDVVTALIGPLQLGSRDQIFPRKFLYYEL